MDTSRSREMFERASKSLAGGVSSQFRAQKPYPLFFSRGSGGRITDVDGNEYLDFTLSQGPVLLGHCRPEVDAAIREALGRGILYAGQHDLEIEVAERVRRHIPCAERVRFGSSGSEMVHVALRAARYVTGRRKILKFEGHYHGWFDNIAVSIKPSPDEAGPRTRPRSVPWSGGQSQAAVDEVVVAPFNDRETVGALLEEHASDLAGVILEPVACNNGCIPSDPGFLRWLREQCTRLGVVLIFDEIITGFRLGMGGAQAYYGVTPDLATFGKAMAAGLPFAMLAGREEFMAPVADGRVIHAGTYNSNTVCMAAALATLNVLEKADFEGLRRLGERFMAGLREAASTYGLPLLVQGPGPFFHVAFTEAKAIREYRDLFQADAGRLARFVAGLRGLGVRILDRGLCYVSFAHTEADVDRAVAAARSVLGEMASAGGAR